MLAMIREGRTMSAGQKVRLAVMLSVPAVVAQLSSIVMQYIDASMVGSLGAEASAAIGLVSTTTWLFGGLLSAAASGFSVQVAHRIGAGVMLLDMGLEEDIPESQGVQNLKVMHGSHFWARQDAMSEDEMMDALFSGLQIGQNLADEGYTAVGLGNLGERGLLTAFILTAVFFRDQLEELPEHMKSGQKLEKLKEVIDQHHFHASDPLDLLRRAGAPDIAAMVGFILSAAQRKLLVIFDNAVTGSAVLIARALCPTIDDYVCASARYLEPVHQMQMKKLGLKPFVELDQNLDQGMGSAMGLTMLDASVQMMNENLK